LGHLMLRCPMTDRNFSTAPIAALSTPWGPKTPLWGKAPGQADCAVDAVNIGRRVGRATLKKGGRGGSLSAGTRSSHDLAADRRAEPPVPLAHPYGSSDLRAALI
jgi:hypothetical protein